MKKRVISMKATSLQNPLVSKPPWHAQLFLQESISFLRFAALSRIQGEVSCLLLLTITAREEIR